MDIDILLNELHLHFKLHLVIISALITVRSKCESSSLSKESSSFLYQTVRTTSVVVDVFS